MPVALFYVVVASVIRCRLSNLAQLQAQMSAYAPSGNSGQNDIIFDCSLAVQAIPSHV
jgi:hypothetical protein